MLKTTLDFLQVTFWSLTYILMIYYWFKQKGRTKPLMPLIPGCLNLAWEINANFSSELFYGALIWLCLDAIIYVQNMKAIHARKKKFAYLVSWLALSIVIKYLFEMPVIDGKLYSVYILDIVMAGIFLVQADLVAREGQIVIACTKLLGDLFAWLAYCDASIFVGIIGFIVLILNIFYLSVCLERVQKKGAAQ